MPRATSAGGLDTRQVGDVALAYDDGEVIDVMVIDSVFSS